MNREEHRQKMIGLRRCLHCQELRALSLFAVCGSGGRRKLCVDCYVPPEPKPKPIPKGNRLCLICGDRPKDRFDDLADEMCRDCRTEPTAKRLATDAELATIALRALRICATGRMDGKAGPPMLGPDGLREIAQSALAAVEAAR